jgi:hypothetical protein
VSDQTTKKSDGPQAPISPEGPQSPMPARGPQSPMPANGASRDSSNGAAADTPRTPPEPRAERCPECGAPAEPGQAGCLSCGSRIELPYRKPPSWHIPAAVVGGVATLALLGGGLALRETTSDATIESNREASPRDKAVEVAQAAGSTTGVDAATPVSPSPSQPPEAKPSAPKRARRDAAQKRSRETADSSSSPPANPSASAAAKPTPKPKSKPKPKPAPIRQWPAGASGWTAVLVSRQRRSAAEKNARRAIRAGIPAGMLDSDDFSSLTPGYWVVFAGRTSSRAKAEQLAERYADKGFADAYARFVEE